ncbi:MAG: hypothetical protein A4E37_00884 [Methanoregulaceae archaeon PtaB.Bin056]|nr:MAG: hypothetical protein A4E37_00884 [Methanoregulaceae archaeon PtaB.Bin056]
MSAVPSKGQNEMCGSVVPKPQSGHRFSSLGRERNGMSGMKRKRKKNGMPASQNTALTRRDPPSRTRLFTHGFVEAPPVRRMPGARLRQARFQR